MDKEVKLIMKDNTLSLNDENFLFLDFVEGDVQTSVNTMDVKGIDGVMTGASNFAPFDLELRFIFIGTDINDYHLQKHKLRQIIYQREPYYVWHSDMPGKKYAVLPSTTSIEDKFSRNGEVTIKFTVYKGYSESLKETDEYNTSKDEWQFESGVLSDDDIKYEFDKATFQVYNGSSDVIDPIFRHKLKIIINIDAPNGFKMTNKTTGDTFEYTKPLKSTQTLVIDGVHPLLNNTRVGINTNFEWIRLKEGFNTIKITGTDIGKVNTQWVFPFIYR